MKLFNVSNNHLPLVELSIVNNNHLPLMKLFTVDKNKMCEPLMLFY